MTSHISYLVRFAVILYPGRRIPGFYENLVSNIALLFGVVHVHLTVSRVSRIVSRVSRIVSRVNLIVSRVNSIVSRVNLIVSRV